MTKEPRTDDTAETPLVPSPWRLTPLKLGDGARFVLAFLLILGLQAGAVGALNVTLDPRAEFGTGLVPPLVADHASMRVHLLNTVAEEPRTLVLGNSRSMNMGTGHLEPVGQGPVFNFAIGAGSVADALAIYRYMADQGYPLEQVILGVDLVQLQRYKGVNHKVEGLSELEPYTQDRPAQRTDWDQLLDSFDQRYVWDSLRSLGYLIAGRPASDVSYGSDGQVIHRDVRTAIADGRFDGEAQVQANVDHLVERFRRTGGGSQPGFEDVGTLIEEARGDDVTVRLFIPPMHPMLNDALADSAYEENRTAMRETLQGFCQPGVHLHDLHRLETFEGRPDRFLDAWHPFGENHRLVAEALVDPALDLCEHGPTAHR